MTNGPIRNMYIVSQGRGIGVVNLVFRFREGFQAVVICDELVSACREAAGVLLRRPHISGRWLRTGCRFR